MSSQYQNKYTPTTKEIYTILDNLEDRLNRYTTFSSYGNGYNKNYLSAYNKNNQEIIRGNERMNGQQTQLYNQNIEINNNIKNLFSNEFNTLIIPFQRDINANFYNLESKINSIYLRLDKLSNSNNNNINNLLTNNEYLNKNKLNKNADYISREEFESKNLDLKNQILLMNSSIESLKNILEKNVNNNNKPFYNQSNNQYNENKTILEEINNLKETIYKDIEQANKKSETNLKEYDVKMKNILEDLNIIKEDYKNMNYELNILKSNINKIQKDNESNSKEKYSEKSFNENLLINDFKEYKNKISNLENDLKNFEENTNSDMQYLKKEISNLDLKFKNIEKPIINSDIDNSINNNNNVKVSKNEKNNEYIEGLIRNYIQDFKKENENNLNELISKLDNKNEEIFKYFEKYDNTINNLNIKIEKMNDNLETDNKKKFNHLKEKIEKSIIELNESNIGFNNESRFANNIVGNENINNIKLQIKNQNLKIDRLDSEIKDKLINIDEQILNNEKKISSLEEKIIENRDKIKKIEKDGFNNKKKERSYFDEVRKKKEKIYTQDKRSSKDISNKNETNKDKNNKSENNTLKNEEKKEKEEEILSIESLLLDN